VESEYATTSEYKQKSDYDVSFIMFEGVMEVESIWSSALTTLKPQALMSR
jgi:hypothetical protein